MIVLKENERFYLDSWSYNGCRILTELAKIITANGGRVKKLPSAIISNRSIEEIERNSRDRIAQLENVIKAGRGNEHTEAALQAAREKLAECAEYPNEPITVTHTSYISFILNDVIYYYELDRNMFFPFYYSKTPIKNNQYSRDAALEEDAKNWWHDYFFTFRVSDEAIKEAANAIFKMLVESKNSKIIRDSKRQRVANTYNSGYHYETIYSPERFAKVDF